MKTSTEYWDLAERLLSSPRWKALWWGDRPGDEATCSYLMRRVYKRWMGRN